MIEQINDSSEPDFYGGNPLNFEDVLSLQDKLIVVTDYTTLKELEEKIKHRNIFLLVVKTVACMQCVSIQRSSHYVEEFFGHVTGRSLMSKSEKLNIPNYIRVKNYLFSVGTCGKHGAGYRNGTDKLQLRHITPVVYQYNPTASPTAGVELILANELLNIERNSPDDSTNKYIVVRQSTAGNTIVDLDNYKEAETIFIDRVDYPLLVVTDRLPNLKTLEGNGRIKDLNHLIFCMPNIETIKLNTTSGIFRYKRSN